MQGSRRLGQLHTRQMESFSRKRDQFLHDCFHKISADVVHFCLDNRIGTIVLGVKKLEAEL